MAERSSLPAEFRSCTSTLSFGSNKYISSPSLVFSNPQSSRNSMPPLKLPTLSCWAHLHHKLKIWYLKNMHYSGDRRDFESTWNAWLLSLILRYLSSFGFLPTLPTILRSVWNALLTFASSSWNAFSLERERRACKREPDSHCQVFQKNKKTRKAKERGTEKINSVPCDFS